MATTSKARQLRRAALTEQYGSSPWARFVNSLNPEPADLQVFSSITYGIYCEQLRRILYGRVEVKAPEAWDRSYIRERLVDNGSLCVFPHDLYGLMCLDGHPSGTNVYRLPVTYLITNPVIQGVEVLISNGVFDYTQPEGVIPGVMICTEPHGAPMADIISKYARKLAMIDASLEVNLINTRTPMILTAESAKAAKTSKAMYEQISRGEPAIFVNDSQRGAVTVMSAKNAYIGAELMDLKHEVFNDFLTDIGLNNAAVDKKERLLTDEVNANNEEIATSVYAWKECLKQSIERVHKAFPELKGVFDITIKEPEQTPPLSPFAMEGAKNV